MIVFSKDLAIQRNRLKGKLVRKLKGVISKGFTTGVQAARMALKNFFELNHEGCVVRAKAYALKKWWRCDLET